jgi:hypothetical protein
LNENLCPEFFTTFGEKLGIGLPACFSEGIQGKADQRALSAGCGLTAGPGVLPQEETDQNAEEERNDDEAAFDGHGRGWAGRS